MTVKYIYNCTHCGVTYLEQRVKEETQFFVACQTCNVGTYEETSKEVIAPEPERAAALILEQTPTEEPTEEPVEEPTE